MARPSRLTWLLIAVVAASALLAFIFNPPGWLGPALACLGIGLTLFGGIRRARDEKRPLTSKDPEDYR
jgi:uncharacterized membrane protein YccC